METGIFGQALPTFLSVSDFAPDLTKIIAKYRQHDPPPAEEPLAA
jgi:hypothetical protein